MKILIIADEESKSLWDFYTPDKLEGIDLIISCGDLKAEYLEFLVTMSKARLLYVPGNHDTRYTTRPPEGCENIDGKIFTFGGIRFFGLGGSMKYGIEPYMYTEKEMQRRIRRLRLKLKWYGGFDILLTHAPIAGFHDGEDTCHRGFEAFSELLESYRPKYCVHGHMHMNYGVKTPRLSLKNETVVVNAFRNYTFDYDDPGLRTEAEKYT